MSEDNILNLEEEPSAPVDQAITAEPNEILPAESRPDTSTAETGLENREKSIERADWEQEMSSGIQRIFCDGLLPIRNSIATLEESLRSLTSQLDSMSSGPEQNEHLQQHASGMAATVKRILAENSAKAGVEFAQQIEAERSRWESDFELRLGAVRGEAAQELEAQREEVLESNRRLNELEEQLAASRVALELTVRSIESSPSPVQGSTTVPDSVHLRSAVTEINSQRTQADTLSSLIRNASHFASRIAFFVVRSGLANGWKASGFGNGLDDESVKTLSIPVDNSTLIGRALLTFESVAAIEPDFDVEQFLGRFGVPSPERALAIPLVVRGRAAAVLYADSGPGSAESQTEGILNQTALEVIMDVGAMGVELLPTRRSEPAPTVTRGTTPLPRPDQVAEVRQVVPTPTPTPVAPTPNLAPPTTDDRSSAVSPASGETRELPRSSSIPTDVTTPSSPFAGASVDEPSTLATEAGEVTGAAPDLSTHSAHAQDAAIQNQGTAPVVPAPSVAPSVDRLDTTVPETASESEQTETAPVDEVPPSPDTNFIRRSSSEAGVVEPHSRVTKPVPDQPPTGSDYRETPSPFTPPPPSPVSSTETEQRAHNDARRFARLLVSEIKLYNGSKVNEGRRNNDLYTRLAEEILRSRKVYEKRVSPAVAARFDYFYDELVQTLAEGDKDKLGADCPGPILR